MLLLLLRRRVATKNMLSFPRQKFLASHAPPLGLFPGKVLNLALETQAMVFISYSSRDCHWPKANILRQAGQSLVQLPGSARSAGLRLLAFSGKVSNVFRPSVPP